MPIPLKDDEPPFDPDTRLLHIIAQHTYHGEAFIAGNQAALKVLRDTIDAALNSPAKSFYSVHFCCDGEGYAVRARCENERNMALMPYGYTGNWGADQNPWPWWMTVSHRHDIEIASEPGP